MPSEKVTRTSATSTAAHLLAEARHSPAVRRVVGQARRAGQVARESAALHVSKPSETHLSLRAADFTGTRPSGLLRGPDEAKLARKAARRLGLSQPVDDLSAWAAFNALGTLLRVVDNGRRNAVVVDTVGERSLFSRWCASAGFCAMHPDVTRPGVVGASLDPDSADLVARLHPHDSRPEDVDEDLAWAAGALRRGGVISITAQVGEGAFAVADLRSLVARANEQGLALVGDLDPLRARRASLALLSFRRR